MATLITFWEVSLFFFFIDIEINILQQQCEHIEILRHIIIILCVSIVVVFMPHIQFFLSLSSPLMNKFMFRRLKTREWVQSGGRDKFSYIWRGGNFFGRGRKRHSALTIRNYQKMYIYGRQGRCVCVPFIISMWLIEIRIRKWKQWTWIFQFRSFLCSYEIFLWRMEIIFICRIAKRLYLTFESELMCERNEHGDSWLAIKRVAMYFRDYQMTFVSTWPIFHTCALT